MNTVPHTRLPALFIGHGSPMNALETNRHTQAWRQLGHALSGTAAGVPRPKAVLAVSAHWYTRGTAVTVASRPETIHDFHGFPPELFAVRYPAPGDPALAQRVQALLQPTVVVPDRPDKQDQQWGLDHGTWSVLTHVFPQADVPVVQLSIDATQPAEYHYELGRRLAPLREEGVLILGSGNVVHNLRVIKWGSDAEPYPWATDFNDRLRSALAGGDHQAAIDYQRFESAALSVPTPEHYLPLLYVLGAAAGRENRPTSIQFPTDGIELGSISMLTVCAGDLTEEG